MSAVRAAAAEINIPVNEMVGQTSSLGLNKNGLTSHATIVRGSFLALPQGQSSRLFYAGPSVDHETAFKRNTDRLRKRVLNRLQHD